MPTKQKNQRIWQNIQPQPRKKRQIKKHNLRNQKVSSHFQQSCDSIMKPDYELIDELQINPEHINSNLLQDKHLQQSNFILANPSQTIEIHNSEQKMKESNFEIEKNHKDKGKGKGKYRKFIDKIVIQINKVFDEIEVNQDQIKQKEKRLLNECLADISSKIICKQIADILDIYGAPGVGKTYTVKQTLISCGLEENILWVNALTYFSKPDTFIEAQSVKTISVVVIDEFDMIESPDQNLFAKQRWFSRKSDFQTYIQRIVQSKIIQSSSMKFIVISNEKCENLDKSGLNFIKNLFHFSQTISVAFSSYSLSEIYQIILHKLIKFQHQLQWQKKQQNVMNIFSSDALDFAIKKASQNSRDLREIMALVINIFISVLESKIQHWDDQLEFNQNLQQVCVSKKDVEIFIAFHECEKDCVVEYISKMSIIQKQILKVLIQQIKLEQSKNQHIGLSKVPKKNDKKIKIQGKRRIFEYLMAYGQRYRQKNQAIMDCLIEWKQVGLIELIDLRNNVSGFSIMKTYAIKLLIDMSRLELCFT